MAIYHTSGTISEMSEVQTGTGKNGNQWQRMSLVLDVPGFQGAITKQVFQAFGESVDDVLEYQKGDRVDIGWSMYARQWKDRWYNNVDIVTITPQDGEKGAKPEEAKPAKPSPKRTTQENMFTANPEEAEDLPF